MKHLNLRRIWAVIVMVIMVLQLLPMAAIAETVEEETAAVEPVAEAVEPTEEEPAEQSEEPEQAAEPGEEPEEPAAEATDPEAPAEPVVEPEEPAVEPAVEPEEPVVEPEEPAVEPEEPAVEPEEPEAEPEETKAVPYTVDWNDYTITVEGAPEDAEIQVQDAENYMEALQQLTEAETVETLFALSLSKENVKLDEKATVTISGKALNELADGAILAEIDETDTAKTADFDYTAQTEEEDASITFRTSVLDRFALILPSEATVEPMGDDAVTDDQTDPEPMRGVEPYVATGIQKTWSQSTQELSNGMTYSWSIGWTTSGSGYSYDGEGRLVICPEQWNKIQGKIAVQIVVNCPTGVSAQIDEDEIEITIPRYIFYGWDGEVIDNHLSFDRISREKTGDAGYYFEEVGDSIIIRNWKVVTSGTLDAEFGYSVDPLKINGGHPIDNEHDHIRENNYSSGERWWQDYTDYYQKEFPVSVRIDLNRDNDREVDYTGNLGIAAMTRATSSYLAKPLLTGKKETFAPKGTGVFFGWDNTWGTAPEFADGLSADDHFYIIWNVTYGRGHHKNYPKTRQTKIYNYSQGWEAMISSDDAKNVIEINGETFNGETLGILRHVLMTMPGLPYTENESTNFLYWNTPLKGLVNGPTNTGGSYGSQTTRGGYYRSVNANGSDDTSVYSHSKATSSMCNYYAILIAYPKSAITAAGIEQMSSDGLTVKAVFDIDETWDSGYTVHDEIEASTRFTVKPTGGSGVFSKTVTLGRSSLGGGQSYLLNGEDINLNEATTATGSYDFSWISTINTFSPTVEDRVLGQKFTLVDTKDSTLLISSSKTTNSERFSAADTEILTDDDYQFNGFYFAVSEWDADVFAMADANGEVQYVWTQHANEDDNPELHQPLLISVRKRGSSEFEPYCAGFPIKDTSWGGIKFTYYLWNGTYDENGLPVKGAELKRSWGHFSVPDGTVQIRVEHDSDFYRCQIKFSVGVRILATDHVKEIVQRHVDNGAYTYIRNVTSYSTEPLDQEGLSDELIAAFSTSGSNWSANGDASGDTFTLMPVTNNLNVSKSAFTPNKENTYQQAATADGYQIAYIQLMAKNSANGLTAAQTALTDHDEPYKLLKGTFYELLPKGTNIQPGSIFGFYSVDYWDSVGNSSVGPECLPKNYREIKSKKGINWEAGYWFKESRNEYTYTLTPNWNGTEQTMLRIDYEIDSETVKNINPNYAPAPDCEFKVFFYFIMENPIENIALNGQTTMDAIAFANRTENGIANPVNDINAINAAERPAFTNIDPLYEQITYNKVNIVWNTITYTESGFVKGVRKVTPESIEGIPESTRFKSDETVAVGKEYEYRLQFSTKTGTRSDEIVFYDILESGIDGSSPLTSADWRGKLMSIDLEKGIKNKVSITSASGAKCDPVVYYSTTLVCKNSELGDYFDLTDGSKWSTTPPSDLGTVTAIAIDCSKDTNGEAFTLGPDASMSVYLTMKAPLEYTEGKVYNGAVVKVRRYSDDIGNSAHSSTRGVDDGRAALRSQVSVSLRDLNIGLHKASNPKTGEPEARTIVKADGTGTIVYRLTVRNDMPFDAENVVITDPIPEGLTVDHVTVKLNGASAETDASATEGFTFEQSGQTCTFTIAKQYPTVVDETGAVTTNKDTEIYIYTTVDELKNADGSQVLLRDYDNTATLVSANGKDINTPSETTYHRAETTLIPVEKIWDDDNDRDGLRPTTIDVTLTGKAGEDTVVTETTTLDKDHDWKGKFENLPKYDIDDENTDFDVPTTYTEIVYTLSEQQVEHYEEPVIDNENHTITNKHVPEVTEVSANKKWKNADGTAVPPQGAKVTYTLYADGVATQYKVELKGAAGTAPTTMGGYESEAWTASFVNLPKYRDHGTEIVYTIAETVTYPGYTPSTTQPVANGGTITNTQETTEVSANKKWKNADGTVVPPQGAKVTYTLYADGQPTTHTVELKGAVGTAPTVTGGYESVAWTAKFVNLPKFKAGTTTEIVYTIAETVTYPGYTPSTTQPVANGGTITNTQETTEISANKKWKNADGTTTPPEGAKVTYTLYADGVATEYTVELKGEAGTAPTVTGGYESEAWTASFVNLPKYKAGTDTEIVYTIGETVTYPGYTPDKTEPVANGETITNEQDVTEASAHKAWKNADGSVTPPQGAKVTYTLYADGVATDYTVELKGAVGTAPTVTGGYESEAWVASFVNLPEFKPGTTTKIVYTIAETVTYPGYTPSTTQPVANGGTITNTQDVTEVSANKKWKNADGTTTPPQGAKVTYTLYADGQPTTYTVELKGAVGTAPTVTGGYESAAWTAKFVNLPKFKAGTTTQIVYTIAETVTYPGYTPSTTQPVANGGTITNTQETTEISANKKWKNLDGSVTPPEGAKVTYTLYADGTATEYTVELKGEAGTAPTVTGGYESAAWTAKFVNLPKFKAGTDTEIVYTIGETVTYPGYAPDKTEPVGNGETITNEQKPFEVSAHKAWKNADGTTTPPEGAKVTYTLYADGQPTQYTVELKGEAGTKPTVTGGYESEAWTASFVNLPKYKAGTDTEIVYTIAETVTYKGYTPSTTEPVANGGTITNEQDVTEVSANKKWKNADGTVVPPEGAKVTYTLYADGVATDYTVELKGEAGTKPTVTGGYESEAWTAKFVNLPKFKAGTDTQIVYTIAETVTYPGYTPSTTQPVANGGTITNEQDVTEISANKAWKNADGTVVPPEGAKVTYTLYADGAATEYTVELKGEVGSKPTVTGGYESEAWTVKFVNLPKFKAGTDTEIVYTIAETVTYGGYTPSTTEPVANGETITNTQDVTEVSANKAWKNADGTVVPPEGAKVTYTLYADGVATDYIVELKGEAGTAPTVTGGYESEAWTAKFVNLPKFKAGTDTEIVYTIGETVTYKGYTPDTLEPVANGGTITNEQDVTEVSAHKAWLNADETTTPPEGAKVTYTLYADGVATDYIVELKGEAGTAPTVTGGYESEEWTAKFVNLPKFKTGTDTEIVYTIGETVTYTGYTPDKTEPVANGETITNVQEATEATVKKVWNDDEDRDGMRPESLTLVLSNGAEVVLNAENEWTATVDHLPKIDSATGEEIEYTWTEKDLPEGYTLTDTSKEGTVTTLTNTHEPEKIELKVEKVWDDVNNRDRVRPSSITVTLLANDEIVETVSITPDADGNWEHTFTNLNKYSDHGTEIKYTIEEEKLDLYVPEYEETSDGFKITNTYLNRNPRIVISGQKTWNDKNNYEGKRPSSITIRLYADGVEVNVATVTAADGWHYAFIDLPKFNDDGEEIVYTITEDEVYGYITEIHGYDVTNTFVVQTGDNAHPGLWITILSLAVLAGAAMLILERKSRKQRSN